MPKFPDPTKQYNAEPIEATIDVNQLKTDKYTPPPEPVPPPITLPKPVEPPPVAPSRSSPFRNLIPVAIGLGGFFLIAFLAYRFILPRFLVKEPEPVTLTYWGLWEPQSVMQVAISDYERLHSHIKINYSMQSPKDYRVRLQNAIAQGNGPDVVRIHNTWLPMFQKDLAPAPVEVVPASDLSAFYPIVQENFLRGGRVYALPMMIDGLVLIYNEDIFAAKGITQPPVDWNELRKLAFQLTEQNAQTRAITRAGMAMGTAGNVEHWSDVLGLLMLQNSASVADPASQSVQDALTFYTIFSTQDHTWDSSQPNSIQAFASGSVAMIIAPSWQVLEIRALNPSIKLKVAPTPKLANVNIAWATYWAEAVPRSSVHQKEAWEFIKYLTSPETLQKLYAAESQIRAFGEPYPRTDLGATLTQDPYLAPVISQAPYYKSAPLAARTWDEGLNDNLRKYYEDAVNAINNGSSVASVTKTLQSGVQQVLSRYPEVK